MRISFGQKLIFSYCFVILASFSFIAIFLDKNLEENSLQNIQSSLIAQANLIEPQIPSESLKQEDTASLEKLLKVLSPKTKCRITIVNTKGKVLADSEKSQQDVLQMENHLYRPEVKTALSGNIGSQTRYSPTLKIDMLYVALPLKEKNNTAGVLRLALPLESVQKTLFAIRKIIFIGLLLALGLAFVLGSIMASRTIKPINRMIQVSRQFSEGDFSRRVIQLPKDEIGELARTLNKMAQDIENKVKEVKAQNQKLSAIFNSMIEGVIVIDKEGCIVSINPTVEKIFGVSRKGIEGKVLLEALRNNDIAEISGTILKDGKPVSQEITLTYPVRRIFEVNATPIFDNGVISGCLIVIHDITEIRRLETIRSDFVANVSHELKTPLTSIKGFVETLLEGALDDKENNRNFLKIIQEHAGRLVAILVLIVSVFVSRATTQKQHIHPIFSTTMRLNYWKDTLKIIKLAPWTGVGLGNFNLVQSRYAHNSYLQIWAEMGILGIISILWLIIASLKSAFKNIRNSTNKNQIAGLIMANVVFLIHNFVDFSFFLPEVSLIWWVVLGIII